MLRKILTDPIVIAVVVIELLQVAIYSFDILTPELFDFYIGTFFGYGLHLLVVVALLYRLGDVTAAAERRFWHWLVIAFACWFAGQSVFMTQPTAEGERFLFFLEDVMFLCFYGSLLLASSIPPDRTKMAPRTSRLLLQPSVILCGLLFVYFVVVFAIQDVGQFLTSTPSRCFWVIMNGFLAVRFAWLHGRAADVRWRRLYGLLALAFWIWLCIDTLELLTELGLLVVSWGTPFDLLWDSPFLLVIAAACFRRYSPSESADAPPIEVAGGDDRRFTERLVAYGLAFPVIHAGLFALGWFQGSEAPRQIVALAGSAVLIGVLIARRRRRPQETDVTIFVSDEVLQESQRMEALGRLAGGVAHDFNNMLLVIRGYGDLLREGLNGDEKSREHIDEIHRAVDRAASMTQQLLAFSRRQMLQPEIVDLNVAVLETGSMLRRLIGEDVALEIRPSSLPCPVRIDRAQLTQIIVNLAVNARHAMPDGGCLRIVTAAVDLSNVRAVTSDGETHVHGPYVLLQVSDDGVGMDSETRSRLFEPFFTRRDEGTGLGLATVYGIARQSGGFIAVTSKPREGSTFDIYLPREAESQAAVPDLTGPEEPARADGETILLAEDEDSVREMTRGFLTDRGYRVLEARDGREAIRICDDHENRIDLLLTDVVMPELGGKELAERARTTRPDLKVLYVSGYPEDIPSGPREFLGKPFSLEELEAKIRTVLHD